MTLEELQNKRITFFVPEAPPSYAGTGINAFQQANYVSKYARQTTICHLNYNRKQLPEEYISRLKIKRFTYYNYNLLTKIGSLPRLLIQYSRQIHGSDIIFIYSGFLMGFQFIIIIAAFWGKQVIFRSSLIDGDDALSLMKRSFLIKSLNKYSLKKLTLYFSINTEFSKRFQSIFHEKIPIFESYQGIDENRFHPVNKRIKLRMRQKIGIAPDDKLLVSAGILLYRKGYDEIFATLSMLEFKFILFVLGEISPSSYHHLTKKEKKEMLELNNSGKELLGEKLIFTGAVSDPETYFWAADFFIHGSRQEGTPNALLEAMACGLMCIVKKLKGISGHLIQNNQNVFEYSTTEDLHSILNRLQTEPDKGKHIGDAASKTIRENYTFEKVIVNLFDKING